MPEGPFNYTGTGVPTFKQTVQIILPAGAGSSAQEKADHGGKDPTAGPVGDNKSGDSNNAYGTGPNGEAANGFDQNGSNAKNGKSTTDSPTPEYVDDNGNTYQVEKDFVMTVYDSNGTVVSTIHWHMTNNGTYVIDKQE